jgi:hypothetical protein
MDRDRLENESKRIFYFNDEENIEFEKPILTNQYPSKIEKQIGDHTINKPFVCELSDSYIFGKDAIALSSGGKYILENDRGNKKFISRSLIRNLPFRPQIGTIKKMDTAASLVGHCSDGFYHWIIDYLPKIQGIRKYEDETDTNVKLIIRPNPPEYVKSSLKLLDYWDQTIEWQHNKAKIKDMIIPTAAHKPIYLTRHNKRRYIASPTQIDWTSTQIKENINNSYKGKDSKYIYISRNDARNRRVINEEEILKSLPEEFESYILSELDFERQVELFSNAEFIISPHGAGLTNLIWGSNMKVIELWGVLDDRAHFFRISEYFNHTYSCLKCNTINDNLIVDNKKLIDRVNELIDL